VIDNLRPHDLDVGDVVLRPRTVVTMLSDDRVAHHWTVEIEFIVREELSDVDSIVEVVVDCAARHLRRRRRRRQRRRCWR
jgi:hypothetical protein